MTDRMPGYDPADDPEEHWHYCEWCGGGDTCTRPVSVCGGDDPRYARLCADCEADPECGYD